jgi:hypothetical protein
VLPREQALETFLAALREFAPDWEPLGDFRELTARDPDDWASGAGTFGTTLRNRRTGRIKVLGRRRGQLPGADYCRGVSFLVLRAYREGGSDPMRRYLDEVGLLDLLRLLHPPEVTASTPRAAEPRARRPLQQRKTRRRWWRRRGAWRRSRPSA